MNRVFNGAYSPYVRAGAAFALLSALSFYIGMKLSGIFSGQAFYVADPLSDCVYFRDFVISFGRGMFSELLLLLILLLSAFCPFCPAICAFGVVYAFLRVGLMLKVLTASAIPLYGAKAFFALCVLALASLATVKSPFLRSTVPVLRSPSGRAFIHFLCEFLVISGAFSAVFVSASLITHFF